MRPAGRSRLWCCNQRLRSNGAQQREKRMVGAWGNANGSKSTSTTEEGSCLTCSLAFTTHVSLLSVSGPRYMHSTGDRGACAGLPYQPRDRQGGAGTRGSLTWPEGTCGYWREGFRAKDAAGARAWPALLREDVFAAGGVLGDLAACGLRRELGSRCHGADMRASLLGGWVRRFCVLKTAGYHTWIVRWRVHVVGYKKDAQCFPVLFVRRHCTTPHYCDDTSSS